MRLTIGSRLEDANKICEFAEWILKIGDGEVGVANDGEVTIDIPKDILIHDASDPITSIVEFTYPKILNHIDDLSYFQEKAILAPTNMNDHLLKIFSGEEMVYLSCDSIDKLIVRHQSMNLFSHQILSMD